MRGLFSHWSIAAAFSAVLLWSMGAARGVSERKLADLQPFSASVPASFTCKPEVTVTVRAPEESSFTNNRVDLQKLIGGVRAIFGFECPNTAITNLLIVGEAGGRQVYRGSASGSANWVLADIRTPPAASAPASPAVSTTASASGSPIPISDTVYYFSATIPAGWSVSSASDPKSFLRVAARSPGGDKSVNFYALHEAGDIDLDMLAGDPRLFTNLGPVTETRDLFFGLSLWPQKIWHFILDPTAIDKSYGNNSHGLYTLGRFTKSGTYGYVILADARSADFSTARSIFESFKTHVPFYANWKNKLTFEGIYSWLVPLAIAGLLTGVLFLLGKSGQFIRKGVELKRLIKKAKSEAMQKNLQLDNSVVGRENRKAILYIFGPLLGLSALYSTLAAELPVLWFLVSLSVLIIPVLGFFGIFFKVKVED